MLDTCGCKIVTPGVSDDELLRQLSNLCGQVSYRERGSDGRVSWLDVMTVAMLRQLPPQFMVIIRGACAPVIAKLARGWQHPQYRRLARGGRVAAAVADVVPEPLPTARRSERVLTLVPPARGHESARLPWPDAPGPGRHYPFSPGGDDVA